MFQKWSRALLLISLFLVLTSCTNSGNNSPTPTPIPQVVNAQNVIFTVKRGPIISQQDVSAEIVPAQQDTLYFRTSGNIDQVMVKSGDTFKKGGVLAQLQLNDLQDQLQQAQIDLQVSQDNLVSGKLQQAYDIQSAQSDMIIAQDQVDLARSQANQSGGTEQAQINLDIAQEKFKTAQAYLALIQAKTNTDLEQTVKRNQLAVDRLLGQVSDRQLIAPYDGVVLSINLIPGAAVIAYNVAAVVGNPTTLVVRTPFEYDLSNGLDANTSVSLYLTKDKQKLYPVKYIPDFLPVSQKQAGTTIDSSGTATSTFLFFTVPTGLPRDQLKVGSQVYLQIILGSKQDALLLPPPAIRGNDQFKYVIVLEDNVHRRVEVVQIGIQTPDMWEVIANLKEGDQILGP